MIYAIEGKTIAKNGTSKLTPEQVQDIKRILENREISQYALAKRYKVNQSTISRIARGIVWPELAS